MSHAVDAWRLPLCQPMKSSLGPHPDPPPDLEKRALPIRSTKRSWFRIHRLAYGPQFFGRSGNNRFDAPGGEFSSLYAGADAAVCFIETFGHATGIRIVDRQELSARGLARIVPQRPLRLVDLTSSGLARLGADARLTVGESYDVPHRWALALHEHPERPDGILYTARHDPARICAALFDRAEPVLKVASLGSLGDAANAALVVRILDMYDFGLV